MPLVTNVFRRGSSYYFRTRVPARFRVLLDRKELWRSLRTTDAREARQRASCAVLLTERLWVGLDGLMSSTPAAPSPAQIKTLIDDWLRAELREDEYLRTAPDGEKFDGVIVRRSVGAGLHEVVATLDPSELKTFRKLPQPDQERQLGPGGQLLVDQSELDLKRAAFRAGLAGALTRHRDEDGSLAEKHVEDVFRRAGFDTSPFTDAFELATRRMIRAHRDVLLAVEQRDQHGWRPDLDDDPAAPLLASLAPVSTPHVTGDAPVRPGNDEKSDETTISEALTAWAAEARKLGDITEGRITEYETAGALFVGWLEKDPPLTEVSPAMAGRFREDLVSYPVNASKSPAFRGLSIRDRVEKARSSSGVKTLSVTTIKGNYLDPLRGLFDWARSTGRVGSNPFSGVTVARGKSSAQRAERGEFTADQLGTLFAAPVFTGAEGDSGVPLYRSGVVRVSDWRYWLPLLALFTGARLNELAGLRASDFDEEEGVSFFHVRPSEERRLKTAASKRIVPVHAVLIDLGFLEVIEQVRASGGDRIFPDLKPGPRGHLSHTPSKFFGRLIDRVLGEDANVVFHSFRHTFITAMRAAGVAKELRTALVGHEDGDTHDSYGSEPISRLNEAVQSVVFTSVDIERLRLPARFKP